MQALGGKCITSVTSLKLWKGRFSPISLSLRKNGKNSCLFLLLFFRSTVTKHRLTGPDSLIVPFDKETFHSVPSLTPHLPSFFLLAFLSFHWLVS